MNRRDAKIEALEVAWQAVDRVIGYEGWNEELSDEDNARISRELDQIVRGLYRRMERLKEGTTT